ncbi:MAG: queuosine precursor transporter [Clostridiales bacterium]|nr:queuosine precursor transporter [Clostridiales bacterium]
MNELLLLVSVVFIYGAVLLSYMLFGKSGLYAISAIATVFANIEVLILVKAFGLEQTLGNVLFASTFLVTDILSECEGKKAANKAVYIGLFATLFFLALSASWLCFVPSELDEVMPAFRQIFTATPRIVGASLAVYVVSQIFDVWLYHKWWSFTEKKFGDKKRFLWLRNNGSTLVSQLINSLLFTVLAFVGTCDFSTLMSIFGSGYIIFIFTSLLDTPVLYLARRYKTKYFDKALLNDR